MKKLLLTYLCCTLAITVLFAQPRAQQNLQSFDQQFFQQPTSTFTSLPKINFDSVPTLKPGPDGQPMFQLRPFKKPQKGVNAGAIDNNKTVHFLIKDYVDGYYPYASMENNIFEADVFCKAYALDVHWLIVAKECIEPHYTTLQRDPDGLSYDRERVSEEVKDYKKAQFFSNDHLVLVYTPMYGHHSPFVRVFAVEKTSLLFNLTNTSVFKVNTSRLAVFRDHVFTRTLKAGSQNGNTFQLNLSWSDWSALSTDPLFIVDHFKNEYLIAYNDGKMDYALQFDENDIFHTSNGRSSNTWTPFFLKDLHFIKDTISAKDPSGWERVKTRLFYGFFSEPYFVE